MNAIGKILGINNLSTLDFWKWAYSDILTNTNRGVFAEFLVASALNLIDHPRVEWDAVDLLYKGIKIEIKSSAYIQSWNQKGLSEIRYSFGKKRGWDAKTNTQLKDPTRSADCYVFCLFAETDHKRANVLDLSQWEFYVLLTDEINEKYKNQKSVSLSRIQSHCRPVTFAYLKEAIDKVLSIKSSYINESSDLC